jgi:hypothetical protein
LKEQRPTVRQNMSRKGNCSGLRLRRIIFQNAESGLETLDGKHSEEAVRQSLFMCIEAYYNRGGFIRRLSCLTQGESLNPVYRMGKAHLTSMCQL